MTFSLAELMICAASRTFDNDGEALATGIGLLPRLAARSCHAGYIINST